MRWAEAILLSFPDVFKKGMEGVCLLQWQTDQSVIFHLPAPPPHVPRKRSAEYRITGVIIIFRIGNIYLFGVEEEGEEEERGVCGLTNYSWQG